MQLTYRIASLNMNGILSPLKMYMLRNFLIRHDIDVALLQEVTHNDFSQIYGYETHLNEGTEKRGTALIIKEDLSLTNVTRLTSGSGIAGLFRDTWPINIYAPSGSENRHEGERFFINDLAYLLPTCQKDIVLAGDFNCVISAADSTGSPNISRSLASAIQGLALHDACDPSSTRPQYTHYTNNGATRLGRIYIMAPLQRKTGIASLIAPFSAHLAVVLRLTYHQQTYVSKNRGWRLNTSLLEDKTFRETLTLQMKNWRRTIHNFPTKTMWWERHVKKRIRQFFQREGAMRNKDRKDLEDFYYAALCDAIRTPPTTENLAITIRRLTAKIRRLSSQHLRGVLTDTEEDDVVLNEDITTYHYVRSRKRSKARLVTQILDNHGDIQKTS